MGVRAQGLAAAFTAFLAVAATLPGEEPDRGAGTPGQARELQGAWKLLTREEDGKREPAPPGATLTITDDRFTFQDSSGRGVQGTIRVESGRDAKTLVMTWTYRQPVVVPSPVLDLYARRFGMALRVSRKDHAMTSYHVYKLVRPQVLILG